MNTTQQTVWETLRDADWVETTLGDTVPGDHVYIINLGQAGTITRTNIPRENAGQGQ